MMQNWIHKVNLNKKIIVKYVVAIVIYLLVTMSVEVLIGQKISNIYGGLLIHIFVVCVYIAIWVRKNVYKYAHIYVFALILLSGVVQIVSSPPVVGISWDDEIHYIRTAYVSWGANGKVSPADMELYNHYQKVIYERKEYTGKGRNAWVEYIDTYNEENCELIESGITFSKEYIAYIPSAIGLAIGHLFGMTFTHTFMLGKFFSLLCYAFIICLAMKQVDRGKLLMAVIAMFPTNIFLAASYSYDWWITCLVMLGYALFLKEIQNGKKITTKQLVVTMLVMVVALLPKAVYFLLLVPLMFFKDDRYENPKVSRWMIVGTMVILLSSFILPMLFAGSAGGDLRGGMDVDGTGQMKFILSNPFAYVGILIRFLMNYLSPDTAGDYMTFYAYMGRGSFHTMTLPLLAAVCILDNNAKPVDKKENIWVTVTGTLAVTGSIVLVVTAMYVAFTPVGSGTVNGCQPRYLTPIVFPALYLLTKMQITVPKRIKENVLLISTFVLMCVYLYNLRELCMLRM